MSGAGSIGGVGGGGAAAVVQALDWKDAVETIADTNIALTGEQTLKGLLTSGSRVGVIGQTSADENGIYVSAAGAWARAVDADSDAKVTNGMIFVVGDSGSTEVGKAFILTTPDPIVLDTTLLTFTLFVLALHASSHQNGGADEINVGGLSGVLADPQPASLATLTDLDSVGDLVFPKVGAPTAAQDSGAGWVVGDHIQDTVTGIIYAAESVAPAAAIWRPFTTTDDITTTTGPTRLRVGAIADGEKVIRTGATLVGAEANPLPTNYIDRLNTIFNNVTSVRVGPGDARDKDDTFNISHAGLLTATITVGGAGGLDTGAEAADTWYAVHVIADSTGVESVDALLSVSRTAPTLPAGYDKSRHVGWVRNNSSSDFIAFNEVGNGKQRLLQYDEVRVDLQALNNGGATALTTVDLANFVPPNFPIAILQLLANSVSDDAYVIIAHDASVVAIASQVKRFGMNKDTGGFDVGFTTEQIVDGGGDIQYAVSVGTVNLDIFVSGFKYILD